MNTSQLSIEITDSDMTFLEKYARKNRKSLSQIVNDYILLLKKTDDYSFHPDIEKYAGFLPADLNIENDYHNHLI